MQMPEGAPESPTISMGIRHMSLDSVGGQASLPMAEEILDAETIKTVGPAFAQGGYADVYQGEWLPPGQTEKISVAIKALRLGGMRDTPEGVDRLERVNKRVGREMYVWEKLSHPRIVPFLGYMRSGNSLVAGGNPCLVSPFYKFRNLAHYLFHHPDANRLALLFQAAEGLNYLHTLDPPIVHLDIKAENVLIDDSEEALICDFGVSRVLDGLRTGLTTGGLTTTINYTCPEVLLASEGSRKEWTPAADVFSFGGLILEVLDGKPPYYGRTPAQIMKEKLINRVPHRDEHKIPMHAGGLDSLWGLLGLCWDIDPLTRPSMVQVMEQLRLIQDLEESAVDSATHPADCEACRISRTRATKNPGVASSS